MNGATLAYDQDYNLPEHLFTLPNKERGYEAATSKGVATDLSFVVPLKDEEETLVALCEGIAANVPLDMSYEIVLVDDGSVDHSWTVIEQLSMREGLAVRAIRFRTNRGKAAALAVGFESARGKIVFTMDADLQDDPAEIPRFLDKLEQGFDLVSGWKQVRHDPWHKVLPSRVFNRMLSWFSDVTLHDHNCGFKCYRSEVAKELPMRGELHRMTPAMAGALGYRVGEIAVTHHPRLHGRSKYGIERFIRGFSDMLSVAYRRKYRERPAHFANEIAGAYVLLAIVLAIATPWVGGLAALSTVILLAFSVLTVAIGLLVESAMSETQRSSGFDAVIERVELPPVVARTTREQKKATTIANAS